MVDQEATAKAYKDFYTRIAKRAFGVEDVGALMRVPHTDRVQIEIQPGNVQYLKLRERLPLNPYLVVVAMFDNETECRVYCIPAGTAPEGKVDENLEKDPPPRRYTFPKSGRVIIREFFGSLDLFDAELADEYVELDNSTADFLNSPLEQAFEALAQKAGVDREELYSLTCAELADRFHALEHEDDDEEEEEPASGPAPKTDAASTPS